jgi:hypothetical protein
MSKRTKERKEIGVATLFHNKCDTADKEDDDEEGGKGMGGNLLTRNFPHAHGCFYPRFWPGRR